MVHNIPFHSHLRRKLDGLHSTPLRAQILIWERFSRKWSVLWLCLAHSNGKSMWFSKQFPVMFPLQGKSLIHGFIVAHGTIPSLRCLLEVDTIETAPFSKFPKQTFTSFHIPHILSFLVFLLWTSASMSLAHLTTQISSEQTNIYKGPSKIHIAVFFSPVWWWSSVPHKTQYLEPSKFNPVHCFLNQIYKGYRIKVSCDPWSAVLLGKFFMCPMSEKAAAVANANKESLVSDLKGKTDPGVPRSPPKTKMFLPIFWLQTNKCGQGATNLAASYQLPVIGSIFNLWLFPETKVSVSLHFSNSDARTSRLTCLCDGYSGNLESPVMPALKPIRPGETAWFSQQNREDGTESVQFMQNV